MNSYDSPGHDYLDRWLTPQLVAASHDHPVLVLTGARQVGKSTLLQHAAPFSTWPYVSFDDFDRVRQADEDPHSLWQASDRIVLDEVQKVPRLLSAVKLAVDADRRRRFVLSGSANLALMHRVTESLAGRAVSLVLDPMTLGEAAGRPAPEIIEQLLAGRWPPAAPALTQSIDPLPLMLRGLMPPLLAYANESSWVRWWEGYTATYLERDLRQLSQVESLTDFRQLMRLVALRSGQLLNQSELARDAGLSQATAHRYVGLLEASHLLHRIPVYSANRTTGLMKMPRVFLADPGLASYLAGYFDMASLSSSRELGGLFETLVYLHLRVLASLLTPGGRLFTWRTRRGDEVDFVLQHGRKAIGIEVKATHQPGYKHAEGLRAFMAANPEAVAGLLLYQGDEVRILGERIAALPWQAVAG